MYPSKHPYNPNDFIVFWTPFTRFFQFLCVSHFSLFRSKPVKNEKLRHVANVVYFILFSLLHGVIIAHAMRNFLHGPTIGHNKYKESPSMYYVKVAGSITGPLAHMLIHIEAFRNGDNERQLYQHLNEIHRIFAMKLNYVVDYQSLCRRYQSVCTVFVAAMIFTCISCYHYDSEVAMERPYLLVFVIVSYLIFRSREYQMALALTALNDALVDLEVLLRRHQIEHNRTQRNAANIQYLRKIYSNAWSMKCSISKCFGWTLITLIGHFTVDMIQSSYWIFINLKYYDSRNFSIREYFARVSVV